MQNEGGQKHGDTPPEWRQHDSEEEIRRYKQEERAKAGNNRNNYIKYKHFLYNHLQAGEALLMMHVVRKLCQWIYGKLENHRFHIDGGAGLHFFRLARDSRSTVWALYAPRPRMKWVGIEA